MTPPLVRVTCRVFCRVQAWSMAAAPPQPVSVAKRRGPHSPCTHPRPSWRCTFWVDMNVSPHTSRHGCEICLFGSLGSLGLSAPYPLLGGFIRGSAQECFAPSPKDLRRYGNEHPSASTAASGSGGLASAPAFIMRVACAGRRVGASPGARGGRRLGGRGLATGRTCARAREHASPRGVRAIGTARRIRKRLQRAEQFNVLLRTEQFNVLLRTIKLT